MSKLPNILACPSCGQNLEDYYAVSGVQPDVGRIAVCVSCLEPSVITLGMRKFTDDDRVDLGEELSLELDALLGKLRERRALETN